MGAAVRRGGPSGSRCRGARAAPPGAPVESISSWLALAAGPHALLLGRRLARLAGSQRGARRGLGLPSSFGRQYLGRPAADPLGSLGLDRISTVCPVIRACHDVLDSARVASAGTHWTPDPFHVCRPRLLITDENPLLRSRVLRPEPCTWWRAARVCFVYTKTTLRAYSWGKQGPAQGRLWGEL